MEIPLGKWTKMKFLTSFIVARMFIIDIENDL